MMVMVPTYLLLPQSPSKQQGDSVQSPALLRAAGEYSVAVGVFACTQTWPLCVVTC